MTNIEGFAELENNLFNQFICYIIVLFFIDTYIG